jgi:hypothetical protein
VGVKLPLNASARAFCGAMVTAAMASDAHEMSNLLFTRCARRTVGFIDNSMAKAGW